tara:strand:- start:663 stop:866 length:204 start_codon:yes stop_codon:yes gene_type:complete
MGNIGIFQLLVIAVIVVLLFGTKRLRHLGGDLGYAIKSFRRSVSEPKPQSPEALPGSVADTSDDRVS